MLLAPQGANFLGDSGSDAVRPALCSRQEAGRPGAKAQAPGRPRSPARQEAAGQGSPRAAAARAGASRNSFQDGGRGGGAGGGAGPPGEVRPVRGEKSRQFSHLLMSLTLAQHKQEAGALQSDLEEIHSQGAPRAKPRSPGGQDHCQKVTPRPPPAPDVRLHPAKPRPPFLGLPTVRAAGD